MSFYVRGVVSKVYYMESGLCVLQQLGDYCNVCKG